MALQIRIYYYHLYYIAVDKAAVLDNLDAAENKPWFCTKLVLWLEENFHVRVTSQLNLECIQFFPWETLALFLLVEDSRIKWSPDSFETECSSFCELKWLLEISQATWPEAKKKLVKDEK